MWGQGDVAERGVERVFCKQLAAGTLKGIDLRVGPVVCEDAFYAGQAAGSTFWPELGVIAAEMESSALFLLGQLRRVPTASLLTVANRVGEPHVNDQAAFQAGLESMIGLALATLSKE